MTANELRVDVPDQEKKPEPDWKSFEETVNHLLGSSQERLEKNIQASSSENGTATSTRYYDKSGNIIDDLRNVKNGQVVLKLAENEQGQKTLDIYANKNAAMSNAPLLRESFSYKQNGTSLIESRTIAAPGKADVIVESSFNKETLDLTFSVNKGNTHQSITLGVDAEAKHYQVTTGTNRLEYSFKDGKISGIEIHNQAGVHPVTGADFVKLTDAAEQSLKTLRAAQGIPEPLREPANTEQASAHAPLDERGHSQGSDQEFSASPINRVQENRHDFTVPNRRVDIDRDIAPGSAQTTHADGFLPSRVFDPRTGDPRFLHAQPLDPTILVTPANLESNGFQTVFKVDSVLDETHIRHQKLMFDPVGMIADEDTGKALAEVFGDSHGLGVHQDFGHHGINNAFTRKFMTGDAKDRADALKGLEDEVMEGNFSAIEVLRKLALVDAVRGLRTAKTPEEAQEALRKLAGMELGEAKAKEVLEKLPGADEMLGGLKMSQTEKEELIESARYEARAEKLERLNEYSSDINLAVTGNLEERVDALYRLEQQARGDLREGKTESKIVLDRLKVLNIALEISNSDDPSTAAQALKDLSTLSKGYQNDAANTLLSKFNPNSMYAALTQGTTEERATALDGLKKHVSEMTHKAENFKQKSATDILAEYGDQKAVESARAEMKKFAEDNFKKADQALQTFLDRNASREQRENALFDLQNENQARIGALRNFGFAGLVQEAELAHHLTDIKDGITNTVKLIAAENSDSKAISESRRSVREKVAALTELARTNPAASQALAGLQGQPNWTNITKALEDSSRESETKKALENLSNLLPKNKMDDMRLGRILRSITDKSTSADYDAAITSLKEELKQQNSGAEGWLEWANTGRAISLMNNSNSVADLQSAHAELQKLIEQGNPYARAALSGILVADADPKGVSSWYKDGNGVVLEKPQFVASMENITKLGPEGAAIMQSLKLEAAKTIISELKSTNWNGLPDSSNRSDRSKLAALALAYTNESQNGRDKSELSKLIDTTLRDSIRGRHSQDTQAALLDIISSDAPRAGELGEILSTAARSEFFGKNFMLTEALVSSGNVAATEVMAKFASGVFRDSAYERRAVNSLASAGQIPTNRHQVEDSILRVHQRTGDNGSLLEALGAVASNYTESDQVPEKVRAAINAGVQIENSLAHASAVQGMLKMASLWTNVERDSFVNHMSKHSLRNLSEASNEIPAELRTQILDTLAERAHAEQRGEAEEKKLAIQALGAMSKHLSTEQLSSLISYGGKEGLERLKQSGLNGATAESLQTEAGRSILSTLTRAEGQVRTDAFKAIETFKFGGITENGDLRTVLAAMAKNEPFNLELLEKVNKLAYDIGVPRPLAAILKNWDVQAADNKELFDKANEFASNLANLEPGVSGEQMARRIAANIELYNSLPPQARLDLFHGKVGDPALAALLADPIAGSKVVAQGLGGSINESSNSFLLRDLSKEFKAMTKQANIENFHATETLKELTTAKRAKFDELVKHTSAGVTLLEKLGYIAANSSPITLNALNYDPFDTFQKKQDQLLSDSTKWDGEIGRAKELSANAEQRSNLFSFATDIHAYTDLRNSGRIKEADMMLVSQLWSKHGDYLRQYSPTINADLFSVDSTQLGRSALGRLHDNHFAALTQAPQLRIGTSEAMGDALKAMALLSESKTGLDAQAIRNQAMQTLSSSAGAHRAGELGRELDSKLEDFSSLLQAAQSGRKYDGLVTDLKFRAGELRSVLAKVTADDRAAIKRDYEAVEAALKATGEAAIKDPETRKALEERRKGLLEMTIMLDPNSAQNKQIKEMFDQVLSPNFKADTMMNWLKTNGPKMLAITVAMAATAGICFLTMGAAAPLATIAWSAAAGVAADEIQMYVMSKVNEGGYTGWGVHGQKNLLQKYSENEHKRTYWENVGELLKIEGTYLGRIALDTAMGLGVMGACKFVFSGLKPSSLGWNSLKQLAMGEGPSLQQIYFRAQRAALLAEGKSTAGLFAKNFMIQTGKEILIDNGFTVAQSLGAEAISEFTPQQLKKTLQDYDGAVSFTLGTSLSMLQGLLLSMRPGGGRVTHFEAKSPQAEIAFIKNYHKEGFRVAQVEPGRYHLWPPNSARDAAPFVLQRGNSLPPTKLFPEGYSTSTRPRVAAETSIKGPDGRSWNQFDGGKKSIEQVTSFTEHFAANNFEKAIAIADSGYPEGHKVERSVLELKASELDGNNQKLGEFLSAMGDVANVKPFAEGLDKNKHVTNLPQTYIEVADNVKVDIVTGKTATGEFPVGESLQKFNAFRNSENGKRILAEHALIAIEEKIHLMDILNGGKIMSPSYARFAFETAAAGSALDAAVRGEYNAKYADTAGRAPFTYEQQAILALRDSNPQFWTASMLEHHFGSQHSAVRKPVIEWLKRQEQHASGHPAHGVNTPVGGRRHHSSSDATHTNPEHVKTGSELGRNPKYKKVIDDIESKSTNYFLNDLSPEDLAIPKRVDAARAQQAIFKHIEKVLAEKPSASEPSLADKGWAIYQSRKESPADSAKIDYILVNTETGQYHILDATAKTKDTRSEITKNSIIPFKDNVTYDPDSGDLMGAGREVVKNHIDKLTKMEASLNVSDYPPPSFGIESVHKAHADVQAYRAALARSSNADVRIFADELHKSEFYASKEVAKTSDEYKNADAAFQRSADSALKKVLSEFLSPPTSAQKPGSSKPSSDNRTQEVDAFGKLTVSANSNRFEWKPSKAADVFEQLRVAAIEKATGAERSRLIGMKGSLPGAADLAQKVSARLRAISSDQMFGVDAASKRVAKAVEAPNLHEAKALESLKKLSTSWDVKPTDANYSPDVHEILRMNLQAKQEGRATGTPNAEIDAAQKLMNDYRADNPEAVAKINEYIMRSSDDVEGGKKLGRNASPDGATAKSSPPAASGPVYSKLQTNDPILVKVGNSKVAAEFYVFVEPVKDFKAGTLVGFDQGGLKAPANAPKADQLSQINAQLYRDRDGNVYREQKGSFVFMDDVKVVPETDIHAVKVNDKFLDYKNLQEIGHSVQSTDASLPRAGEVSSDQLLKAIASSPEVNLSAAQLELFNNNQNIFRTAFNPTAGNMNCMETVAALQRTMRSGKLLTAPDVRKVRDSNGLEIGPNRPQNATTYEDARKEQLKWLAKAANLDPTFEGQFSVNQLSKEKIEQAGTTDFAVVVRLPERLSRDATGKVQVQNGEPVTIPAAHVFYARFDQNGNPTYYDPQSGVRWSPESVASFGPDAVLFPLRERN